MMHNNDDYGGATGPVKSTGDVAELTQVDRRNMGDEEADYCRESESDLTADPNQMGEDVRGYLRELELFQLQTDMERKAKLRPVSLVAIENGLFRLTIGSDVDRTFAEADLFELRWALTRSAPYDVELVQPPFTIVRHRAGYYQVHGLPRSSGQRYESLAREEAESLLAQIDVVCDGEHEALDAAIRKEVEWLAEESLEELLEDDSPETDQRGVTDAEWLSGRTTRGDSRLEAIAERCKALSERMGHDSEELLSRVLESVSAWLRDTGRVKKGGRP